MPSNRIWGSASLSTARSGVQVAVKFLFAPEPAIEPGLSALSHRGHGQDEARQGVPHAHCIVPSPDNRFALVTDLGTDEVFIYRLDAAAGCLVRVAGSPLRQPSGSGPRHIVFHPNGMRAYVINELNTTIGRFEYSPQDSALRLLDVVPALPDDAASSHSSALQTSADGRFLYGSFRGDDSIACYPLDPDGRVLPPTLRSSGGKTPRSFTLSPSGNFLLVANQDGDLLMSFRVDRTTGQFGEQVDTARVGTSVCVQAVQFK